MIDTVTEWPLIEAEAALYGPFLDPAILKAIRMTENGAPGREFGVLSVSAPTYAEQLSVAAATVAHRLWSYPGNPITETAVRRLVVSNAWIAWFASIWAPQGVVNDPNGLNANWVKNFTAYYTQFIQPA